MEDGICNGKKMIIWYSNLRFYYKKLSFDEAKQKKMKNNVITKIFELKVP